MKKIIQPTGHTGVVLLILIDICKNVRLAQFHIFYLSFIPY